MEENKHIEVKLNLDGSINDDNIESMAEENEFGIAANKFYNDILFYYNPTSKTTRRKFVESWYEEKDIPIEEIMKDWYEKVGKVMFDT
jgi:hypothetical protein